MIKLSTILKEIKEKNLLNSRPNLELQKKFEDVTKKMSKLFNSKIVEKEILYNNDDTEIGSMLKPSIIAKQDIVQHIGEYKGNDFKAFTKKIAQVYEQAGFKLESGYGSDDIKGFEVKGDDGEVLGEVDFLEKDSIPNHGHTIIIKYKKQ